MEEQPEVFEILLASEKPLALDSASTSRFHYLGKVLNHVGISSRVAPRAKELPAILKKDHKLVSYLLKLFLFFHMIRLIRKGHPRFVISRSFYVGLWSIILAKIFRFTSIYDFHGFVWKEEIHRGHRFKWILTKYLETLCIKHSDWVMAQTDSNRAAVLPLNQRAIVVRNGVDLSEFSSSCSSHPPDVLQKYSLPASKPLVGFIGNWENWMRIEDLLEASSYLNSAIVVVVGQGRNFYNLKKKYTAVIFTGRIPHEEAMQLLLAFSVCVAPYSKDPIMKFKSARKTLEYLAAGKPIVISDVVGKEDFLVEGYHCLTYEPENPRDLAKKIELLLADDDLRMAMRRNNQALAKEFTWEKNVKRSGLLEIVREM